MTPSLSKDSLCVLAADGATRDAGDPLVMEVMSAPAVTEKIKKSMVLAVAPLSMSEVYYMLFELLRCKNQVTNFYLVRFGAKVYEYVF